VAVAMIAPLAAERVIEIPPGQWFVLRQHRHGAPSARRRGACRGARLLPHLLRSGEAASRDRRRRRSS
jgi:hypothetical protein